MARSDSEDSNKGVSKSKADPVKDDAESENEGSEAATEYEIEEVLDAKRGYFPDGRMGYFVKWKGYGPDDNSWVDETDAINAQDLVNEFWKKNPLKKKAGPASGRKSVDKKSPKKGRKSAATADSPEVEQISTKKRGRKSTSQKPESEDEMDVDEPVEKPAKKARKDSAQPAKANAKKAKNTSPEPTVAADKPVGNMKPYMHLENWEGLVKSVDTVERKGNKLLVFFSLQTGEGVKEYSDVCKSRFPLKMIDFYESNLRWRQADEPESS